MDFHGYPRLLMEVHAHPRKYGTHQSPNFEETQNPRVLRASMPRKRGEGKTIVLNIVYRYWMNASAKHCAALSIRSHA